MQKHRCVFVFILAVLWTSTTHAQSLRAARESYDRALRRFAKGEFDAAIADFTRAIEINSHPGGDHRSRQQNWNSSLEPADEPADSNRIAFVDPLTAMAYAEHPIREGTSGTILRFISRHRHACHVAQLATTKMLFPNRGSPIDWPRVLAMVVRE